MSRVLAVVVGAGDGDVAGKAIGGAFFREGVEALFAAIIGAAEVARVLAPEIGAVVAEAGISIGREAITIAALTNEVGVIAVEAMIGSVISVLAIGVVLAVVEVGVRVTVVRACGVWVVAGLVSTDGGGCDGQGGGCDACEGEQLGMAEERTQRGKHGVTPAEVRTFSPG